ncbi:family 43 glycosylhydrolase [Actinomadura rudentiformis]|uniref:Family 43 glycosylhydrolase n=1 Tax=Actinomadura rudentiformis TaxID=359158 RepID=A0A6H9YYP3_9ACTN|nr:family 43 glycosylhydrolase [Actinomadura rudentiformis]KAB2347857.1 family 43 glycosylhydrolase [Actinomadura rudentiformis]
MDLRAGRPWAPLLGGAAITTVVALIITLAGSCGPDSPKRQAKPSPRTSAPASPPAPAPPVPSPASTPVPFVAPGYSPLKPVIGDNFADPAVIKVGATYYAYGTNNGDASMPVATAPSPTGPWIKAPADGLAQLPSWADAGWTWAPEVVPPQPGSRTYLLYFSARRKGEDAQCIGVATAVSPAGPFVPVAGDPLVCPLDLGGAIDPASHIDADGTRYLLYKTDARESAAIYLMRLTPDGLRPAETAKRILGRGKDEPVLVEAPDLVRRGGKYVLLYSAGWYFKSNYQTRYAVASSINGPYEKAGRVVQSTGAYGGKIEGPGSADVLSDESGDHLVFHGIQDYLGGSKVNRGMYVTPLAWDGTRPVIRGIAARYEAERARLNGCASTFKRPRASGDKAIGPFDRDGCLVEVPVFVAGTGSYSVKIGYANRSGNASRFELTANGAGPRTVRLRESGGDDWPSTTAEVQLKPGWNTLGLRRLDGRGQIDYLEVR